MSIPRWSQPKQFIGVDMSIVNVKLTPVYKYRSCGSYLNIHSLTCEAHRRERERQNKKRREPVFGFVFYTSYTKEFFAGFSSPWGFPMINLCVLFFGCACLYFSDIFSYGYVVMMLNVIISEITIKKLIVTRAILRGYLICGIPA